MIAAWTQDLAAGAVVAGAAAWLLRRAWARRRARACPGCDGCPASAGAVNETQARIPGAFVPLSSVMASLDATTRSANSSRQA